MQYLNFTARFEFQIWHQNLHPLCSDYVDSNFKVNLNSCSAMTKLPKYAISDNDGDSQVKVYYILDKDLLDFGF